MGVGEDCMQISVGHLKTYVNIYFNSFFYWKLLK